MPQIAPLQPGDPTRLGPFVLSGRLGEGGQGVVYLGEDQAGEQAAVKLLHVKFSGDAVARSRFARELRAAQRVASFCTARVMAADLEGDTPYIASEFIDGRSLRETVEERGTVTGSALERLAVGTATALTAIHQAGIVHRDFKPDNVLLAVDGPRVVDFGIARILDSTATITSRAIGTPAYMAPEQISGGKVGPPADVFSWASTIAYAATGTVVFGGDSIAAVLNRILNHDIDTSALPEPLAGVVRACLRKSPDERPTADQILLRLLGRTASGDASTTVLSEGAAHAADPAARPFAGRAAPHPGGQHSGQHGGSYGGQQGGSGGDARGGPHRFTGAAGSGPRDSAGGARYGPPGGAHNAARSTAHDPARDAARDAAWSDRHEDATGPVMRVGTWDTEAARAFLSPAVSTDVRAGRDAGAAAPAARPAKPGPYGSEPQGSGPQGSGPHGSGPYGSGPHGGGRVDARDPGPAPSRRSRHRNLLIAACAAVLAVLAGGGVLVANGMGLLPGAGGETGEAGTSSSSGPRPGHTFASVLDKVARTGRLTIGVRGDLPGVALQQGTGPSGFEVDLATYIARRLKVPASGITFHRIGVGERVRALAEGVVDMVVATYSYDDNRGDAVTFAGPYYTAHADLLVLAGSRVRKLDDLAGRRMCAPAGSATARLVADRVDVEQVPAGNYAECMNLLTSGKVDAVPGDDLIIAGFANRETGLKLSVLGVRLRDQRYAVGLPRKDLRTCAAVEGAIQDLYVDGTMRSLLRKHFGNVDFDSERKAPAPLSCR
ncbi:serine/threonine-protein kinase [Microbispora triticiradicis]|uniref:serine/threonine-protein kinase n=1 Tax=Microbispora triticiradicis TaxID=2200763 RepID=UPI001AD61CEB|nr:serine/threonine-protein kinase [Microbispora triticiradicis]MBO4272078.1 transporter substrate-binding domain-containing protein [Microbispora triticiradicis]